VASTTQSQRLIVAGFLLILIASAWAFYPGLGGGFIFDDSPNLQIWADIGDITSLNKVLTFSLSSTFTPGRPLSLLSFLIDDQSWPPSIFLLKRTNLALHLLNTCLIFWLSLKVLACLLPGRTAKAQATLALLATAIWSIHPLQVSNVSYIIQRMNLLSTTLELSGLLLFMHGREQIERSPCKALILCSMAIGFFMPLAILAKENGLLLCVFALLTEAFCFPHTNLKWWRNWKLLFLWAPLAAFLVYCIIVYHGFTTGFGTRNFNAWERMLTQGPVLVDYLGKLLLPRLQGSGLYFDNFPVSRSLINPLNTLFAWALLLALFALCWIYRKKQPLIAFGLLFYFCGHLLESTILPLELYFEHRNYLPQIGLWLALAGLLSLPQKESIKRLLAGTTLASLALLLLLTRSNAALWSEPELQAAIWYHDNPDSLRTTLGYANLLLQNQNFSEVDAVLRNGREHYPDNLALLLSQRVVSCYAQDISTRFDDLPAFAANASYDTSSIIMLERMRTYAKNPDGNGSKQRKCLFATDTQIAAIYQALLTNKTYLITTAHPLLLQYLAEIAVAHGDPISLHYYDRAFTVSADPIYPYRQALLLEHSGYPHQATAYALKAKQAVSWRYNALHPDLLPRIEQLQKRLEKATGKSAP